jgi:hypothetical protein
MMRAAWVVAIGLGATFSASVALGQTPAQGPADTPRRFFAAPGYYGMAWGTPSFGYPRTYSEFSSPYSSGFAAGYAPYGLLPGPFGVAMWRPGFSTPGYTYGASYYSTFSYPPDAAAPIAPVGAYAPSLGPGPYYPR